MHKSPSFRIGRLLFDHEIDASVDFDSVLVYRTESLSIIGVSHFIVFEKIDPFSLEGHKVDFLGTSSVSHYFLFISSALSTPEERKPAVLILRFFH